MSSICIAKSGFGNCVYTCLFIILLYLMLNMQAESAIISVEIYELQTNFTLVKTVCNNK